MSRFDEYKQPATFHILLGDIKAGRVDAQLKDAIAKFKDGDDNTPFHVDRQRLNAYLRSRFLHRHKGKPRRSIPKRRGGDLLAIEMKCKLWPVALGETSDGMRSLDPAHIEFTYDFQGLQPAPPSNDVTFSYTERYEGEQAVIVNEQQAFIRAWAALIEKNNAPLH